MARITLGTWIKNVFADPDKAGKVVQFSLVHMLHGGSSRGKELHTIKIGGGRVHTEKDIADTFQGVADGYSQDLVGTQTFQVMAFYEGVTEPQAFFHIKGHAVNDGEDNATHPPTKEGRMMQQMDQESKLFQQVYSRQAALDNTSMSMIQFLGTSLVQAMHENREAVMIVRDVLMQQVTEKRDHELKVLAYQRATEERKSLMRMAPALVNNITGTEVFPLAAEDTALIETIADNLPMEQAMQLSGFLPTAVSGPLMARLHKHAAAKREAREVAEHAANLLSSKNPEDDAVGGDR